MSEVTVRYYRPQDAMETIKGIAVSPGVVIGRVFVLDEERRRIPRRIIPIAQVAAEQERLKQALVGLFLSHKFLR